MSELLVRSHVPFEPAMKTVIHYDTDGDVLAKDVKVRHI